MKQVDTTDADFSVLQQSMMLDADGGSASPGNKPHVCEHCSASFRSSYHLRRHVLIHTGEQLSPPSVLISYFHPNSSFVFLAVVWVSFFYNNFTLYFVTDRDKPF